MAHFRNLLWHIYLFVVYLSFILVYKLLIIFHTGWWLSFFWNIYKSFIFQICLRFNMKNVTFNIYANKILFINLKNVLFRIVSFYSTWFLTWICFYIGIFIYWYHFFMFYLYIYQVTTILRWSIFLWPQSGCGPVLVCKMHTMQEYFFQSLKDSKNV